MDSFEADDATFYQELTRQILMLTDEDDDVMSLKRRPTVHSGVGSRLVTRNYYSWSGTGRCSVPDWMESLWATRGGGTGVFIPSGAATGHVKKSGRRRRSHNNNKATKSNDRGIVYSTGNKICG
ncbi:hypothetical protein QVD17_31948 [Tagetes erecta]|uniref:Uncharacterized protein n=1 Tax=Tagetes erecta TaxID=13708 RepID=A0AAD8NHI8_TARER|nr:hypothetical protein QVD17_31948 [Tagetes erecta]